MLVHRIKIISLKEIFYFVRIYFAQKIRMNIFNIIKENNLSLLKDWVSFNSLDINTKDNDGLSPLHYAVHLENLQIVKYLLSQGADVNYSDKYYYCPLHDAIIQGHIQIVKCLLEYGADVNARTNGEDVFPILYATECNELEIIKCLLEYGADVNAKDNNGTTLLHLFATYGGHNEVIQYLLEHNVDINIKNNNGFTPMELAKQHNQVKVIEIINHFILSQKLWNCWYIE